MSESAIKAAFAVVASGLVWTLFMWTRNALATLESRLAHVEELFVILLNECIETAEGDGDE